jgi:hypothetical protein
MPLNGDYRHWPSHRKIGAIRDTILTAAPETPAHSGTDCALCASVFGVLADRIGVKPISYATKRNGVWMPKPLDEAKRLLRNEIREIHAYIVSDAAAAVPTAAPAPTATPDTPAPIAAPEPSVVTVNTDAACQADAEALIRWIQTELRPFGKRAADGQPFDEVGLRPALNGAAMLREGIRPDAIKHALTLHYPPEARRHLGVGRVDPQMFAPREFGGVTVPKSVKAHDGTHKALPYLRALALGGVPIFLVGPPGTGKTTLAKALADSLGLDFGAVSMTRGTSPSAFRGRPRISDPGTTALVNALIANGRAAEALALAEKAASEGDVQESKFVKLYRDSGVFLFDEIDASDENLLLLTNAALANRVFFNDATGETVRMHRRFVPIAAGNTLGLGGSRKMTGRSKLDAATLDRWNAGRVEVELDEALERHVYWARLAA